MTREPLEERYFKWLYSQVASTRISDKTRSYWALARVLHSTEFVWSIRLDENRAEDGKELRVEFYNAKDETPDILWDDMGCSVFEMLIAVSRRLAFNGGGAPSEWFWILIENLHLSKCNDYEMTESNQAPAYHIHTRNAITRLMFRQFDKNGVGGLFPLQHAHRDQTRVEIWEQLNAYLIERMG